MGGACKMRLGRRAGPVRPNGVVVFGRSGARLASSFLLHTPPTDYGLYGLRHGCRGVRRAGTHSIIFGDDAPLRNRERGRFGEEARRRDGG